jgi:hypothetical protein
MALTGPDGAVIAEGGDEVRFSGSEATDMASFCQVGRLFQVTEIAPA